MTDSKASSPIKNRNNEDSYIKQGFLCPECKSDYQNINELEDHFNSIHLNERSNDNQNNLGNQFNKFLKKILKTDSKNQDDSIVGGDRSVLVEDTLSASSSVNLKISKYTESECYFSLRKDQTIGFSKNYFDENFKKIRNSKIERDVQETNKLLIRIDQLLQDLPTDPEKLRAHEMSVVIWANDEDVRLCPFCAKSFNISRRRHHCRLCGAIMCNDCSLFLDLTYARQLINPVDLEASSSNNVLTVKDTTNATSQTNLITNNKNSVKRASTPSLFQLGKNLATNITNKDQSEYQIKTCKECKVLLDRRMQQITDQHTRPVLKTYYEKLKDLQLESDKLVPLYVKMCKSLRSGENIYQLEDAQLLRIKLMKLGDAMDGISKKILQLNFEREANDYHSLRNKLRLFVAQYLQRNLLGLPSLPYEYELKELQERRHNEIKLALESDNKQNEQDSTNDYSKLNLNKNFNKDHVNKSSVQKNSSNTTIESVSTDNGWNIERIELDDKQNDDPLLMQIDILKKYIEKARQDHRYEELNALESSLKTFEIEYLLQENDKQVDCINAEMESIDED